MYYLDEDIFHNAQNEFIECNTVRIIKDTIRSTCVNDIIYSLYIYIYIWIFIYSYNLLITYENTNIEICNSTLESLRGYIEWVDKLLIFNDKVYIYIIILHSLFHYLWIIYPEMSWNAIHYFV